MKDLTGKYKFKVPADIAHADAGKQFEREYDYEAVESLDEAQTLMATEGWTVEDFVNEKLQNRAKSNSYQNAITAYKPTEMSISDLRASLIRNFIRAGLSEEVASKHVDSILSANNG
jgi:hypothetical protein